MISVAIPDELIVGSSLNSGLYNVPLGNSSEIDDAHVRTVTHKLFKTADLAHTDYIWPKRFVVGFIGVVLSPLALVVGLIALPILFFYKKTQSTQEIGDAEKSRNSIRGFYMKFEERRLTAIVEKFKNELLVSLRSPGLDKARDITNQNYSAGDVIHSLVDGYRKCLLATGYRVPHCRQFEDKYFAQIKKEINDLSALFKDGAGKLENEKNSKQVYKLLNSIHKKLCATI